MQSVICSLLMSISILFGTVSAAFPQCPPIYTFTSEAAVTLGHSFTSAGDVNNDGYADLIVGARWWDADGFLFGRAYVFSGLDGDTLYIFNGEETFDEFGHSAASAGDVNNDGYDDLIIGAYAINSGTGRVYVFSGLDGDTLYVFNGELSGDVFGTTVSSAGDVNNDGYSDLLVIAEFAGVQSQGKVYVFSGLDGDILYIFNNGTAASAGDVNHDGHVDLIVAGSIGPFDSRLYVISGLNGDTLYKYANEEPGDGFGFSAASAGDVNNDGYADLIVGARYYGNGTQTGRAYVFSGLDGDTLYVFTGEAVGNRLGWSVASAGDVNNDGYADLIVGAPDFRYVSDENSYRIGRAYVFSGLNGETLQVFTGEAEWEQLGLSVASAGDVNNDGYSDLIVGLHEWNDYGFLVGRAYVYSGQCEVTAVEDDLDLSLPTGYQLLQNFPNPFNPTTTIAFSLPQAGKYSLTIFNILGQVVERFESEARAPGDYFVKWKASNQASGVYFYRLKVGDFIDTKKMTLLK